MTNMQGYLTYRRQGWTRYDGWPPACELLMGKRNKLFCMTTLGWMEVRSFLEQYVQGDTRKNIVSGKANAEVRPTPWVDGGVSCTGDFQKQDGPALARNSPDRDTDDSDSDPGREMNYMTSWNPFNPFFFRFYFYITLGRYRTTLCLNSTPVKWEH